MYFGFEVMSLDQPAHFCARVSLFSTADCNKILREIQNHMNGDFFLQVSIEIKLIEHRL